MAEMESLYFGMGIDTSQLHSDFVDAEKTINQNLARLNKEMKLIQLHGQIELEGLDESADAVEKLRIQEEALTAQMNLQQDKIVMLSAVYDHLNQTQGANAEATKKVEMQLAREQLAMQRLENQTRDLSKQTEIAFGMNFEMLGLIEPALKGIEALTRAGREIPIPNAKAVAAAGIGILAIAEGSMEATEELREENPAKVLDEDFQRAAISIDDSWQKISESNRRGFNEMRSYSNNGYRNYRNQQFSKMQAELESAKEEQSGILENFAKALGIGNSDDGGLKIFPDINKNDILRVAKVFEDYRFSESLSNAIDLFKESESVLGKLAATATGAFFLDQSVAQKAAELVEAMITNFRELSKASAELNLPLERASDLLSQIALAGADYEDVRDYVRGVQDAVIKGDSEDPEVLALEKYNVVIQDAQGKLLDFDETLERLYQGYLKAREAGEAEGYVMMTNGQAVQDVLPYFENLAQAKEDMAKIKWATIDVATLSNVSHEMKLLETQTGELQNALSGIAAPAAEMAFRNMFEDEKALTELIEENRETIIYWSYVFMEAIETLRNFKEELKFGAKDSFFEAYESIKAINEEFGLTDILSNFFADEPKKEIEEEAKEYFIPFYEELRKLEEEFGVISELGKFLPNGFTEELDNATKEYLVPFYEKIKNIKEEFDIISNLKSKVSEFLPDGFFEGEEDSIFTRAQKDLEEYIKANEEARKETKQTAEELAGLSYSMNRIAKYKSELETLKLDIEFGSDDSYQKQIGLNKIWYDQAMKDARQYADEQAIIEEVNAARLEKIELEKEEKLKEIRDRIAAADRTELENRIADIEKEKESWIQAGMEESEAVELAQKKIAKAQEELTAKTQGYWKNAADIEYELTHTAFEKQIRDIEEWEEAQRQKAETAEEIAGIVAESAAKEAQAFEREMDRIKGKLQSLDDKIFEIDHSQYENDMRRIQQEYLKQVKEYQDLGALTPEVKAQLDYLFTRQKQNLDLRAKDGGDYIKSPEGAMQRGGNGITVLLGDQIIDDGLRQRQINLLTDESQIRAQLKRNLDADARATVERIETTKALTAAQKNLIEQTQSGYQIIEGDEVVNNPQASSGYQQIEGAQIVTGLQNFDSALQSTAATLEQVKQPVSELQSFSSTMAQAESEFQESLKRLSESLPAGYFKNLADNSEAVSEMQLALTKSTMNLIEAQDKLSEALKNLPKVDSSMPTSNQQSTNGLMNLSTQKQLTEIPQQKQIYQPDSGMKFGFDMDTFSGIAQTGLEAVGLLRMLGAIAPHPALKTGAVILGGAIGAGAGVGTGEKTFLQSDDRLGTMPDLTEIKISLSGIDAKTQSILQQIETPKETMTFETIVTPLSNIQTLVGNILTALGNQQPPQVTVSPSISNNLGGAYVFDNAMKKTLVDDITSTVVDAITQAVSNATSRASYGFGA